MFRHLFLKKIKGARGQTAFLYNAPLILIESCYKEYVLEINPLFE
jgi:hypothetical protein